jgi:hypothetical protein
MMEGNDIRMGRRRPVNRGLGEIIELDTSGGESEGHTPQTSMRLKDSHQGRFWTSIVWDP